MTNKEEMRLKKALNHIKKCDGDCKRCGKCKAIHSLKCLGYGFVCTIYGMDNYFNAISGSTKTLKNDMIEAIQFELFELS